MNFLWLKKRCNYVVELGGALKSMSRDKKQQQSYVYTLIKWIRPCPVFALCKLPIHWDWHSARSFPSNYFWSQDPYNRYVVVVLVLGTHWNILLENSQNWKLSKLKVAKFASCQNCKLPELKWPKKQVAKVESCQIAKLPSCKLLNFELAIMERNPFRSC